MVKNTLIIKNFFKKIELSKYTLFLILLVFVTGLIKDFLAILIIIIFHEFGHYLISYIFKWNINKIIIYPFGGYIIYDEVIDKSLFEELLITIFGPIFQIIIYLMVVILYKKYYIDDYFFNLIKEYHYSILLFNILPIIPLDGSKIVNIILNKLFSYKLSYNLLYIVSIICLLFFIFLNIKSSSYYLILSFLIYKLFDYIKNKNYMINRFIYEKYIHKNSYRSYQFINNIDKMKRNRKHIFRINGHLYNEKDGIKKIKGV